MTDDVIREWAKNLAHRIFQPNFGDVAAGIETAARELLAMQKREDEEKAAEADAYDWDALPEDQREGMTKETTYALGHAAGVMAAVQAIRKGE